MPRILPSSSPDALRACASYAHARSMSLLLCCFVLLPPNNTAADELIERGRALAERLCAHCHMAPGQGEKRADNEIPGFAAVAARPGQTLEGLVAWLRSRPPMMPNHNLSQDEMMALAEFILSLRPRGVRAVRFRHSERDSERCPTRRNVGSTG